jgi:hypothetical protein
MTMSMVIENAWNRTARWMQALAVAGLAWNCYGVYQFIGSLTKGPDDMMAAGLSAEQIVAYSALPWWTTVAFALGVFGGATGSILLAIRRRLAFSVLALSAFAYVALFAGDAAYGVLGAVPSQLAIMMIVVFIAFALLAVAAYAKQRNLLH